MARFRRKPTYVEAVQFTGDNWAEMHAFTGHREVDYASGVYSDVFNPIGTYLPKDLHPEAAAELWVAANQAHVPMVPGEWVLQDAHGFYPCQDDGGAPFNYEPAEEEDLRTPADWCTLLAVKILDPDGWRADGQSFEQPITREEFEARLALCTVDTRGS